MSAQIVSKNPQNSTGAPRQGQHLRMLERHLRKQVKLSQACGRRAVAAGDPRLRSAWIGAFCPALRWRG
jgi:hypothetical protein